MEDPRNYLVVGYLPSGEREKSAIVLSAHARPGRAKYYCALFRERLEGYAVIRVEKVGEHRRLQGGPGKVPPPRARVVRPPITCPGCGVSFHPERATSRFCGVACAGRAGGRPTGAGAGERVQEKTDGEESGGEANGS